MTEKEPLKAQLLAVHLHNGFTAHVEGNDRAIAVIKNLLIPNKDVSALVTYEGTPGWQKVESLNFTALKELRAPKPQRPPLPEGTTGYLIFQDSRVAFTVDKNLQLRTENTARGQERWERDGWTVEVAGPEGDTTPESYYLYFKRERDAGRLPVAYPTWARGIDTPAPTADLQDPNPDPNAVPPEGWQFRETGDDHA